MTSRNAEEIRAAIRQNGDAPEGPVRNAEAEALLGRAEATGDRRLVVDALFNLVSAYHFSTESDKSFVPFARLLRLWDECPGFFDERAAHYLHWIFKWTSSGMLVQPHIRLDAIEEWQTEMERRYRLAGHSERAVRSSEFAIARHIGDTARAARAHAAWLAADRDTMSDCHACELHEQGLWHSSRGDDAEALRRWEPVLNRTHSCVHEPHGVLATSLLPLVRLGLRDAARANHLRGYRMVRDMESMRNAVAGHLEFCALTGNEPRGLEILTGQVTRWDPSGDPGTHLDWTVATALLMRRITELGHATRPVPGPPGREWTAGSLLVHARGEALASAARFDERNGTTAVGDRARVRMAAEPLVTRLPLGLRHAPLGAAPPTSGPDAGTTDTVRTVFDAAGGVTTVAGAEGVDVPPAAGESGQRRPGDAAHDGPIDGPHDGPDGPRNGSLRRVTAELALAHDLLASGEAARAERLLLGVLDERERAGVRDPSETARIRLALACPVAAQERPEEAAAHLLDAAHAADTADDGDGVGGDARTRLGNIYLDLGRAEEAVAVLESALPEVLARRSAGDAVHARRLLARAHSDTGEDSAAAGQYLRAAETVTDREDGRDHAMLVHLAADALRKAGLAAEADQVFERAAELWRPLGETGALVRALRSRAWLAAASGRDGPGPYSGSGPVPVGSALELMEDAVSAIESGLRTEAEEERPRLRLELGRTHRQTAELLLNTTDGPPDEEEHEPEEYAAGRAAYQEAVAHTERAAVAFRACGRAGHHERTGAELLAAWLELDLDRCAAAEERARAVLAAYPESGSAAGREGEDAAAARRREAESVLAHAAGRPGE